MLLRFYFSFVIMFSTIHNTFSQQDLAQCATQQSAIATVGQLLGTTYTLKILLVEFQDVKHKSPGYTYTDFNNLFFSNGTYISPSKYSPDNQQVFGSVRDYYSIMSDGEFTLTGYVINPDNNADNVPDWLTLPLRKGQYDSTYYSTFTNAAFAAANSAGLNVSTNATTKLAIIYAGQTYRDYGGLNPRTVGSYYFNGELFAPFAPYREERSDAKFSEIGINVHEFAHLLGIPDMQINGYWDAMDGGPYLGPNSRGACPAPFNPQTRYLKGWISFNNITQNQTFQSDYYLRDPEVFQLKSSSNPNYYWLIETRKFNSTMTIGSKTLNDYNYYILRTFFSNPGNQGVLVWRVTSSQNYTGVLLHADGNARSGWPNISDGDPFPGTGNIMELSPWSDSRTSPSWVPNTKPSNNVGMEIANIGSGNYTLNLYVNNPVAPSKPQNLSYTVNQYEEVVLHWDANTEPDVIDGGKYNIYRADVYGTGQPSSWDLAETLDAYDGSTPITSWDDTQSYVYSGPRWLHYYITAVDNDQHESDPSDAIAINGKIPKISVKSNQIPKENRLFENYPNPFNPSTDIQYSIKEDGVVLLKIYDSIGEEIMTLVDKYKPAGIYTVHFDAENLSTGIYFYSLSSGNFHQTKKMILMR